MSYNKINNIDELKNCGFPYLENVDFEHNEIMDIPEVEFYELSSFNISQNSLKDLTSFIQSELKYLKKLNVSKNKLE